MKTLDFEKKIQEEIDKDLNIRTNPNHDDIAGVYWNDMFIGVSVPPVEIKEEYDANYRDQAGYPYRDQKTALNLIKGKLPKYKQVMEDDPELLQDITD